MSNKLTDEELTEIRKQLLVDQLAIEIKNFLDSINAVHALTTDKEKEDKCLLN